jgi:hypothetical protein
MDDIARLEWFYKLRSQIRGSGSHLIVGIDIAKDKNRAFFCVSATDCWPSTAYPTGYC